MNEPLVTGEYQVNLYDLIQEVISAPMPFTDLMIEENSFIRILLPDGWEVFESHIPDRKSIKSFLDNIEPEWSSIIASDGALSRPMLQLDNNDYPWRLRLNIYSTYCGKTIKIVIRRMPVTAPSIADTGLPPTINVLLRATRGLILITGSTGSGKSTSMAAIVNALNEQRKSHIITIEDPIEYVYEPVKAVFSQREVGVDVPSFRIGVKNALRQRPDIIVIGEVLDRETAETALIASDSGHLVIGTLHANSAVSAISKLLSFFEGGDLDNKKRILANTLQGIIAQVLIPTVERNGYVLASEVLINVSQKLTKLLYDPARLQEALDTSPDGISRSMGNALLKLIEQGKITASEAHRVSGLPPKMYERFREAAKMVRKS
ncbi:type IV pilus twitching motility protein PilT [Marinobacterium sp. BA1]|uniref:type IV pilus twitching motility protein PilT n=1 Tax=Marinobacterium sp. BA1 TaxID=3138931 RepID=UPI0032E7DDFA